MRAHTERKGEMGNRFAIVIGVAAAGLMALGTQTAAAAPDTDVIINQDRGAPGVLFHGVVNSKVRKCEGERRVVLFKQRPGADRKFGTGRTASGRGPGADRGQWLVRDDRAKAGWHVYVQVRRKVPRDRLVCRPERSQTHTVS